ncbi:Lipase class 3 family protein [Giardia muris]|uniref:sn-1-specific diacylglycerol lipase n=1 Tax=Giardia muris TaxID=5742 RepID=A0A4Z1SQN8_GIAMU|nr:Lipase class 3 family protein [Giardia muris]|eukprot:TNJ28174.1 Lipase class 3 family protein [Giardia muris]
MGLRTSFCRFLRFLIHDYRLQGKMSFRDFLKYNSQSNRDLVPLIRVSLDAIDDWPLDELRRTVELSFRIYGRCGYIFHNESLGMLTRLWTKMLASAPLFMKKCKVETTGSERRFLQYICQKSGYAIQDVISFKYKYTCQYSPVWVLLRDVPNNRYVLVIRGTQSKGDILFDIDAYPCELLTGDIYDPELNRGNSEKFFVHMGIRAAGQQVFDALCKCVDEYEMIQEQLELGDIGLSNPKEYGLLITGHSLGAALACIVGSLLLLHRPNRWTVNNLKAIGYGPPAFANDSFSAWTTPWLTNIVYDLDIFARLSYHALLVRRQRRRTYLSPARPAEELSLEMMTPSSLFIPGKIYFIQAVPSNDLVQRKYYLSKASRHLFSEALITEIGVLHHMDYPLIIPQLFDTHCKRTYANHADGP